MSFDRALDNLDRRALFLGGPANILNLGPAKLDVSIHFSMDDRILDKRFALLLRSRSGIRASNLHKLCVKDKDQFHINDCICRHSLEF